MSPEQTRTAVQRSQAIQGWFWAAAACSLALLDEAQKQAGVRGDLFEIGSFHGRSAIFLAHLLNDGETLGICDTFGRAPGQQDDGQTGFYNQFRGNIEKYFPRCDFLRVFIKSSEELTADDTGRNCRILHIDSGHEPEQTMRELELADQAVHENGLVVLDDFMNFAWPGVSEGFFRFMAHRPGAFTPLMIGFNKGILIRPSSAKLYRPCLEDESRCWKYVPRGPYSLKKVRLCGGETFVFHTPSYRSPDARRSILTMLYHHRPWLTDRLARLLRYHGRPQ